jgi:hypothetical protein
MGDQELAIDEIDVSFHAAEAMVQRVQQRAFVLVVIMGMGMNQWYWFRAEA